MHLEYKAFEYNLFQCFFLLDNRFRQKPIVDIQKLDFFLREITCPDKNKKGLYVGQI